MSKIAIISDTHYHDFSRYATVDKQGINSRLADTIRATREAASSAGILLHAGDVFHVRGVLSPTVLNPVMDLYHEINTGIRGAAIYMMPGNHDLKTDDTQRYASNVTPLEEHACIVHQKMDTISYGKTNVVMIPWEPDLGKLRTMIKDSAAKLDRTLFNVLVLHAPLNGVLDHLPAHGLNPSDFDDTGFTHVFCGHYHNHKAFPFKGGVAYSIGALTHQNWGDVGTKAGYIVFDTDTGAVEHHETSAPKFIKLDHENLDDDAVVDNYVKVVGGIFTPLEAEAVREKLILAGAKAVEIEGLVKRPAVTRAGVVTTGAPSLVSVLEDYLNRNYPGQEDVAKVVLEAIREVE